MVNKSSSSNCRRKSTSALPNTPISISIGVSRSLQKILYVPSEKPVLAPFNAALCSSCERASTDPSENGCHDNGVTMRDRRGQSSRGAFSARRKSDTFDRMYIKEGRIMLYNNGNVRDRYLFLFSDLLLVAKEKAINSYRLKERIRLSEMWVDAEKMHEICDCTRTVERSFVIGWPIRNYVAEFSSVEEKNSWYNILRSQIHSEKVKEMPKRTTISVKFKVDKKFSTTELVIDNFQTATEIARLSAEKFGLLNGKGEKFDNFSNRTLVDCRKSCPGDLNASGFEKTADRSPPLTVYQLYVQCGKDATQIALKGHECVFAILLFYVRDLIPSESSDLDLSLIEDLVSSNVRFKCSFYLKVHEACKRKCGKKTKRQSGGASHLVSNLKRKVMRQMSHESAAPSSGSFPNSPAFLDPIRRSPGHLFGRTLTELASQCVGPESQVLPPKPILDAIKLILRDGMLLEGIFRKPPNHRIFREVREKLDAGLSVEFDQIQPTVAASLLKEFLRLLPDSLLVSSEFSHWLTLCDEYDSETKITRAKGLLARLPNANFEMLRHLMCLLYHVARNEGVNQMNSYNLSVCIAPSLLNNAFTHLIGDINGRKAADIVQFFIENTVELFGSETLGLLGKVPDAPVVKADSEEDYDGAAQCAPVASSTDSLLLPSTSCVYVSRDSGLSDDVVPPTVAPQSPSSSMSDLDSPTATSKNRLATVATSQMKNNCRNPAVGGANRRLDDSWSSSGFADVDDVDDAERRRQRHLRLDVDGRGGAETNSALTSAASRRRLVESSADSLYESLDSACSYDSTPPMTIYNIRRVHRRPSKAACAIVPLLSSPSSEFSTALDGANLIRSKSGNHLISLASGVDVSGPNASDTPSSPSTTFAVSATEAKSPVSRSSGAPCTVDRRHAFRQKSKPSPTFRGGSSTPNESPHEPDGRPDGPIGQLDQSAVDGLPQRPVRRKKQRAPSPPKVESSVADPPTAVETVNCTPTKNGLVNNGATQLVKNVFVAQPVLVRCNDSGSGDESGGERRVVTDAISTASKTPAAKLSSSTMMSAATTEIFSLRPHESSVHATTVRARFLSPNTRTCVARNKSPLPLSRDGYDVKRQLFLVPGVPSVADSSNTVTEASSDESTTPHVSRESSRAQELKTVADSLFNKAQPPQVSTPAVASTLVTSSPRPSNAASPKSSAVMTSSQLLSPIVKIAGSNQSLVHACPAFITSTPAPCSNRMRKTLLQYAENPAHQSKAGHILPQYNATQKSIATPTPLPIWDQKLPAARGFVGGDVNCNRRWRRKTLGADEYQNLLNSQQNFTALRGENFPAAVDDTKMSLACVSPSTAALPSTVRDRVKFFDKNGDPTMPTVLIGEKMGTADSSTVANETPPTCRAAGYGDDQQTASATPSSALTTSQKPTYNTNLVVDSMLNCCNTKTPPCYIEEKSIFRITDTPANYSKTKTPLCNTKDKPSYSTTKRPFSANYGGSSNDSILDSTPYVGLIAPPRLKRVNDVLQYKMPATAAPSVDGRRKNAARGEVSYV